RNNGFKFRMAQVKRSSHGICDPRRGGTLCGTANRKTFTIKSRGRLHPIRPSRRPHYLYGLRISREMTMRRLLIAAALAILLPATAHAQVSEANRFKPVLPPVEYDHAFNGPTIIVRGDATLMKQLCPKTSYPVTLGCQRFLSDIADAVTPTPLGKTCIVVIAKDEILQAEGWSYEVVKRHEVAHCAGWPSNHLGARPVG